MSKVVIVGSGNVGSCAAQTLALRGLAEEVVLVDKRAARANAEAADLMCALPRMGSACVVRGGSYEDCSDADVVVVCAAAPARLGQTRNDMFLKNAQIVRDVVDSAEQVGFAGLYVMVSNPVDLLAHLVTHELGVPADRVVGTGTVLDTLRLEDCARGRFGTERDVIALALGEHGEGLVVDWSSTLVDGRPVPDEDREPLRRAAIDSAYDIMKGKGSTSYGIAYAVSLILESWSSRDGRLLPLSVPAGGEFGIGDMTLSLPASFDCDGVPRIARVFLDASTVERLGEVAGEMAEFYRCATSGE